MRYSIPNKIKEKAIKATQVCKSLLAHRLQGSFKTSGSRLDKKYKVKEIIKSGMRSFPVIKWMNSIPQRSNSIITLKKVGELPSVAHKGITNVEGNRKRSHLNFVIFYPTFEKTLSYFGRFQRIFTNRTSEFLTTLSVTFLISSSSFATDYAQQAQGIVQESQGVRDSQKKDVHQFLENIHTPTSQPSLSSDSDEKSQHDSQKDSWGEAPLLEFTTSPTVKNIPDQKEGETCCKPPTNLQLNDINSPFQEPSLQKEGQLLIFVSFSLPDQALRNLYEESLNLKARLILRGLHKNSFLETRKKVQELGIQADIDPTLFEKHVVQVIPTFVLERKTQTHKVSGNISAHEALGILQGELE